MHAPDPGEAAALARLADPTLGAADLHAIASAHPALAPQVAAHPALYPDLWAWLAALRRPVVDAVLAARQAAARQPAGLGAPPPRRPPGVPRAPRPSGRRGGGRGGGRSALTLVAVIVAAMLASGAAVFPFAARAYALGSVLGDPAAADQDNNAPGADARTEDWGIRTLPLLSDEAEAAWAQDEDAAIEEYGAKLFGDQWQAFMDASPLPEGFIWGEWPDPAMYFFPMNDLSLSPAGAIARSAINTQSSSEASTL
ncbi:MAG: hypothetical protein LBD90_02105, partial [Bifidobacteriaceae bacterium]|nr:hypothetical protein [Bifidobacteriaceae bacterium]